MSWRRGKARSLRGSIEYGFGQTKLREVKRGAETAKLGLGDVGLVMMSRFEHTIGEHRGLLERGSQTALLARLVEFDLINERMRREMNGLGEGGDTVGFVFCEGSGDFFPSGRDALPYDGKRGVAKKFRPLGCRIGSMRVTGGIGPGGGGLAENNEGKQSGK